MIYEHIHISEEYMYLIKNDLNRQFYCDHKKQFEEYIKSIDQSLDIALLHEVYQSNIYHINTRIMFNLICQTLL